MTDTTMRSRLLGAAWPQHFNRPVTERMHGNIMRVGLPTWSEADQTLARAVQRLNGVEERGLTTEVDTEVSGRETIPDRERRGGGSDDIGDISWAVPTVSLRFPSNIPGGPGHNWNKAIAMATPIAHKGATAGAKVHAMTVLDLLLSPDLVDDAWDYFRNVQNRDRQIHLVSPPGRRAGRVAQRGHHGAVSAPAGALLLRPQSIRHLSGAARHRVSDRAGRVGVSPLGTAGGHGTRCRPTPALAIGDPTARPG